MPRRTGRPFGIAATLLVLALAHPARGQQRVDVRGVVRDTAGGPVDGADVAIIALHRLARTDDSGAFVLRDVPAGRHDVSVRRLGFDPRVVPLALTDSQQPRLVVVLRMQPAMLPGLTVSEIDMRRRIAIEEFYRRRARGPGTFITRDEIEERHAARISDMLRGVSGVEFTRTRAGVTGVRFINAAIKRRDCVPQIWVDGVRVDNIEVDELPLMDVEGIELYSGPSTTPLRFTQGAISTCGTIVIWSRVPGT